METTLDVEIQKMQKAIQTRLLKYNPAQMSTTEDTIVKVFKKHSRMDIGPDDEQKMRIAILAAVDGNYPIPVSLLWACSGMARSKYKINQQINLPRLGDIWGLLWFEMLHKKIQKIHNPGIEVIIADETPQLILLGWSKEELVPRLDIMRKIASTHTTCVQIIDLPFFECKNISVPEPHNMEIFSIVVSSGWEDIPENILDSLYTKRDKQWGDIITQIPKKRWTQARQIRIYMNQVGQARKNLCFFSKYFNKPYVDATLTEKGRWCPKIWGMTFPQHGGSVLKSNGSDQYSMKIEPEYRLINNEHIPISIAASEFNSYCDEHFFSDNYIFYWVANTNN